MSTVSRDDIEPAGDAKKCHILTKVGHELVHRRTISLAALLLSAGGVAALAERLNFVTLTNRDGLPQRQVMAITQDPEGYLWVGTYGGLSRFNGRSFVHLRTADGLSSNTVQDILPGADGLLWVATAGGGVCQVRFPLVLRCFRAGQELLSDDVMDLEGDGAGGVWVGTFKGITHLAHNGTTRHFPRAGEEELRNVWVVRSVGERLLAGHDGGLIAWNGENFHPIPTNLPRATVRSLAQTPHGLWVGTEAGLVRFSRGIPGSDGVPVVPGVFVQDLLALGETLWVATRSGLFSVRGDEIVRYGRSEGLEADVIHRVTTDREGTLWLGTDSGLVKLVPGPLSTLTPDHGLPHPFVRALGEDTAGRLYVGTRSGIAVVAGSQVKVIPAEKLPGPRVYAFLPRADGSVWAGTSGGVAILRGERVENTLTVRHGLPSRSVYALAPADDGTSVWVATWAGMALLRQDRCLPLPPDIASLRALALTYDATGDLWVALRDGGLARVDRRWRATTLRAIDGFTDQVVWAIARQGESLWFATNGDGALRLTPHGVERWTSGRGLVDDFVWQVLVDRRGRVWLYTSQGLDVLEGEAVRHFDQGDGLPDLEGSAGAAWEDGKGVLWFGTAVGLVRYDPRLDLAPAVPPPILIEGARREDGSLLSPGQTLPASPGAITISLASLSFRNERATRFSYRLLPAQPQWSTPTRESEIRYASLGGGRYRFEAVAVASDGRRSPTPASLEFAVDLPFWRTPAAWALIATAILFSAWRWARWRIAASQALALRLEREVAARTAELAAKQVELEQLAATDELTRLPNRRRFFEVARRELQRLSRSSRDSRLALILLDLDDFKAINDTLGHAAGDAVLHEIGDVLAKTVRATDTAARFGGDEFAILLPMTDREGALRVAEKLMAAIRDLRVTWHGRELTVGVSAGMAVVAPSAVFDEQEVVHLVQRADQTLYAAKRLGGGRVLTDTETWT